MRVNEESRLMIDAKSKENSRDQVEKDMWMMDYACTLQSLSRGRSDIPESASVCISLCGYSH